MNERVKELSMEQIHCLSLARRSLSHAAKASLVAEK
jgi:hypothetical protein